MSVGSLKVSHSAVVESVGSAADAAEGADRRVWPELGVSVRSAGARHQSDVGHRTVNISRDTRM